MGIVPTKGDWEGGLSYGFPARTLGVCRCSTAPASDNDCTLSPSDGAGDSCLEEATLARPFLPRTEDCDIPSALGLTFESVL
jgi:hypothetical protein